LVEQATRGKKQLNRAIHILRPGPRSQVDLVVSVLTAGLWHRSLSGIEPAVLRSEELEMHRLAEFAIKAHGGMVRWRAFRTVSADLIQGGVLWSLKGKAGLLDQVNVKVDLTREWASHSPFLAATQRSVFEPPQRVAIETMGGKPIDELLNPRDSFKGHTLETPWSDLQLAYFVGCAMWTYLNTPFLLAEPGVVAEELEPWKEKGETWRRLKVEFPSRIVTHSTAQTLYFDQRGLLRRHDYDLEITGGTPGAHYVDEFVDVSGILFPTKRRIFPRQPDGKSLPEPLVISIDLSNIRLN
jgi:hypothetical protein